MSLKKSIGIKIIEKHFENNPVSTFQINSFNHFIDKGIRKIILDEQDIEVTFPVTNKVTYYKLSFG